MMTILFFMLPTVVWPAGLDKDIPQWMKDQINQDFARFERNGITQEAIKQTLFEAPNTGLARFKILNNRVSYEFDDSSAYPQQENMYNSLLYRAEQMKRCFNKLANVIPLPNIDFIVCMHDRTHIETNYSPIFVFAKKMGSRQVLIPDFEALTSHKKIYDSILKANNKNTWESKVQKAFWRGATTGGIFTTQQWQSFPRSKLVLASLNFPDLLDAKFTQLCQEAENNTEVTSHLELMGNSVSPESSLRYKYLIDVDGNSCSYSRCYWTLLANSVQLKQVSDNIQWYYSALKPYEHYIPIKQDMSNLIAQIEWAINHDAESHLIADNSTSFVKNNLRRRQIYKYLYLVLIKYSQLQRW